jgi:ketosteroid isomerase-like protein
MTIEPASETALLRRMYEAFNRRDFEAVLAQMHADVDWPNALEGTRVRGRDAVREYWMRQFESLDSTVEPKGFASERDGRIAVQVHQVVRDKSGNIVADRMVEHVCTIRGGLVASMEIRNSKN